MLQLGAILLLPATFPGRLHKPGCKSILVAIHVLIPIITLLGISSLVRLPKSGQPKTCTHLHPKDYIVSAEYKLLRNIAA